MNKRERKMNKNSIIKNLIFIGLVMAIFLPDTLMAIPAFARQHKVSCTTCHTVFPRLRDYGDEFAGNGFIMKESENKRNYITAGDDELWLNKTFPIAARMEAFASYDAGKEVEYDLQSPWGIKLLSGGTLYKNIGYYFYFYMSERGEVAGVEDAYIHFDNVKGSELDVMVGQFQTSDPLMKRELRLTYEDYMIYKTTIGLSNTALAYDRGVMLVYGFPKTGTDLVGFIVNGNGKPEAVDRRMDQDDCKNFGFRLNQGIGEIVTLGGYYYLGKEKLGENNIVEFFGPDLSIGLENFELTAQYLKRIDSNPLFDSSIDDVETDGIVAELLYSPDMDNSKYYITGLYNLVDSDIYRYETATLSFTYLFARNLRLLAEYTYDMEYENNRFVLGIIGGF
jgi:hypothetical protein